MTMILAALAFLAQPAPLTDCATLRFSRAPAMGGGETQRVGICRDPDGRPGDFLFQRSAGRRDAAPVTTYATSRACPAALRQLIALESLELPRPNVPGLGDELQTITMDGVTYRLEGLGLYGPASANFTLESNVGTPLARWIEGTLATLAPCWRPRPGS
jgi:hypothetical protein